MYELLVHDQVTEYDDRATAVKAAKEITTRPDGPMTSTVTDGIETLSFREGKLVAYTYETRRTEQRRNREQQAEQAAATAEPAAAKPAAAAETAATAEAESAPAEPAKPAKPAAEPDSAPAADV